MSARIIAAASITLPLIGTSLTADDIAANADLAGPLRAAIAAFVDAIEAAPTR